jgi:SAM-dependent methyltransferase
MTDEPFDQSSWERRWAQALRESPEKVASRPPNALLLAEIRAMQPGFALDAGCGHGSEAIWLAASGWRVTAVDFSAIALDFGRSTAHAAGADVAERIEWLEGDLGTWTPPPGRYDLVSCLYVHVAGSVVEMVRRSGRASHPAERCSWSDTAPSTRRPVPQLPQRAKYRCRSTRRSRLLTRTSGTSPLRRSAHGLRSAPVSMRWSVRPASVSGSAGAVTSVAMPLVGR